MIASTSKRVDGLRIVQIVNTLEIADGGPARNSFELNRALNRNESCSADLFWLKGHLEDSVVVADGNVLSDIPVPGPRKVSTRTVASERRVGIESFLKGLHNAEVLIIHGYYLWWIPLVALVGRLLGCRVFLMPHGALTARQQTYSMKKKRAFDLLLGRITRFAIRAFVTGSHIERDELIEKFPRAEVRVAGVGVPMPSVYKSADEVHTPLRLLSMSRIAEKKRIDLSIDAVGSLKKMGVDATLIVAGDGSPELITKLKDLAEARGVGRSVSFVGQLSGDLKERTFVSCDFFLLPSEDENFGIGFAEATSFGLPAVVSSKVAAADKLPSSAGVLIRDPSGEKLAVAICGLLDPERHVYAQAASRDFALQNFSWSAAAELWLDAIRTEGPIPTP